LEFEKHFPNLIAIRDSAHHIEDRLIGKAFGKKIMLKPIDDDKFKAVNGLLFIDSLNENKYTYTLKDGSLGELEISDETLRILHGLLQSILHSYKWSGLKKIFP